MGLPEEVEEGPVRKEVLVGQQRGWELGWAIQVSAREEFHPVTPEEGRLLRAVSSV